MLLGMVVVIGEQVPALEFLGRERELVAVEPQGCWLVSVDLFLPRFNPLWVVFGIDVVGV